MLKKERSVIKLKTAWCVSITDYLKEIGITEAGQKVYVELKKNCIVITKKED